jgi:hypothetical protein
MSAVSRALNVEVPKRWAETQAAPARPVGRWGAPIWKAEEPVLKLQNTTPDALPLEIKLLAFIYSGR